jgi:hypothetical protein
MSTHGLTAKQQRISDEVTQRLGYRVSVYLNGSMWICQPVEYGRLGFGKTMEEAIKICEQRNALRESVD